MRTFVAVAVASLVFATEAQAQPGTAAPQASPPEVDTVSEDAALGLSLVGAGLSVGLFVGAADSDNDAVIGGALLGAVVAPSLGHFYSRQFLTRGMGIRALGLAVSAIAFKEAVDAAFDTSGEEDGGASALLLLGLGLYVAGTVDDVSNARSAARKYNARFQNVTLVPTATARGGGVSLVGRF